MELATFRDIRRELRAMISERPQTEVAADLGISQPLLNQLIKGVRGDRAVNPKVLRALGYEPLPYYRRKK